MTKIIIIDDNDKATVLSEYETDIFEDGLRSIKYQELIGTDKNKNKLIDELIELIQ